MEINIANDLFLVNILEFKTTTPSMKEVVSEFAIVWDVPGVLGPVHVRAKLLISNLHKKKYKWSDKLDKEDALEWNHIVDLYQVNFVNEYQ